MVKHIGETGVESALEVVEYGAGKPVIAVTAGVHGDEVTGVYTARRLIGELEKQPPIKGTVRVLPVVNPTAMRCLARRSPFDGADMNRIFPGNTSGSLSERVAAAVWTQTEGADAIIDLHCCSQHLLPYILAVHEEFDFAREHARRITMPVVIRSEGTPGQLFTEACRRRGQAACIIELPSAASEGGVNKPASDLCFNALLDFLRSHGMLEGEVKGREPSFYGGLTDVNAPRAGLWTPVREAGAFVSAGDVLGTLDDEPVPAPEEALLMAVRPLCYVFEGRLEVATYAVRAYCE
ncbi:MAG: succinylglutamate desuccinylase/aspartoacylase family protein [Eubacteriales bacterium]|nr:succinylglutamate desuccinylase/aspartoacylase family protein [Eubacteriales bacterium]